MKGADIGACRNFRGVVAEHFREYFEEMKAYLQLVLEAFAEDGDTDEPIKFT